jgi:hypothetical protein
MEHFVSDEIEKPDDLDAAAVTPEAAAEPAPAPSPQLDPPSVEPEINTIDTDGLARMLAEYDSAIQAQQADAAVTADDLQGPDPPPADELDETDAGRLAALEQAAAEQRHAELERQGWDDFGKMAERAQDGLPPTLPKDFARRWLLVEAAMDPALWQLWSHRNDRRVQGAFRDLVWRMHSEAQWLDPDTISESADRAAVAQMLKSGRGNFNAPEPPLRLGNLSDKEFNQLTEERFGFTGMR